MGEVVFLTKAAAAASERRRKKPSTVRGQYVGINLYIPPHREKRRCDAKRGVAHGILSAFDFDHTSGLNSKLFRRGGVFHVRCVEEHALGMRELIEESLPYVGVRMVRRIWRAA